MARLSADGTTILENYDRFTGVSFNATKVTTWMDGSPMDDSKVDNAIYFKNTVALGGGYSKRDFDTNVDLRWFDVKGDGITDDTVNIQKAINYSTGDKKILSFENKTYIATNLDFKGASLVFDKSTIKRKSLDDYVVRFSGGEITYGELTVDNDHLIATNHSVESYNQVRIDILKVVNNINSAYYKMDLRIRGTADGLGTFYCNSYTSINGGYAGCSVEGFSLKSVFFNEFYVENPGYKGFRCSNRVDSIYINNFRVFYSRGNIESDGFLIDNGGDTSLPDVKNCYVNNFYANGFLSNAGKFYNTGYLKINSFNAISVASSIGVLQTFAESTEIGSVKSSGHLGSFIFNVHGANVLIASIESTTSTPSLFVQLNNVLFGRSNVNIGTICFIFRWYTRYNQI